MPSATRYADQLASLLPSGKAWDTASDTNRYKLLRGLTDEWVRVEENANQILSDAFPQTTETFLDDWERVAGLPDSVEDRIPTLIQSVCGAHCGDLLAYPEQDIAVNCAATRTDTQRRLELVEKLGLWGGASIPYFTSIMASVGITLEVTEHVGAMAGLAICGESYCGDWRWNFVWDAEVSGASVIYARCGVSFCGQPIYYTVLPHGVFWLQRFKPAHTFLRFTLAWYYVVDEGGAFVVSEGGDYLIGAI